MFRNNQIIKGTVILTLTGLISRVLGFLYRIFLSNLIGAEGMGVFQLIFPVLTFCVALSCGGIQITVSRFVAESKTSKHSFNVLLSSIFMSGILSATSCLILFCFSQEISSYIIRNTACDTMLKYASFTIPMAAFHSCISGYYLGLKKTTVPAWCSVFEQIVKLISLYILGVIWIDNNITVSPIIAVYSMLLSEFAGVIFCLIAISAEKKYMPDCSSIISTMKSMFSISYILTINKIMLTFLQCVEAVLIPVVLIKSGESSSDALSIYGILTGMALPVITFPSAINSSLCTMLLPTIAGANANDNVASIKFTTEKSIWFSIVMGIFCTGIFVYFGDFIGVEIFGQAIAGEYIKILGWLCPFMYLSMTFGSILHGLGKTNTAFVHNVIGTIIKLIFLWFLVPVIGITGYLWGLLISNLVVTALHGIYVSKYISFDFSAFNCIIKPAVWLFLSLTAGKLANYILSFLNWNGRIYHFICALISGCVICGIFLRFVLKDFVGD